MENELRKKAIAEILSPTLQRTKQFLDVYTVQFDDDEPKIELVDHTSFAEYNAVYFSIKEEPFFLCIYFAKDSNEIINVEIEIANQVYFTVTSDKLSFEELYAFTTVSDGKGWSLNAKRNIGIGNYKFSRLSFEPIQSRAYNLELKLKNLLTELEKDAAGIKKLTEIADAVISIHLQNYCSSNMGLHFDTETINRISALNLSIDIDQYVSGTSIK